MSQTQPNDHEPTAIESLPDHVVELLSGLDEEEAETLDEIIRSQNAAQQPAETTEPEQPTLGGWNRRDYLKAGGFAGFWALLTAGSVFELTDPARADAEGVLGTQTDPYTKTWTHAVGAGNGAAAVGFDDPLTYSTEDINSAGSVTEQVIKYDSTLGGFPIELDSDLEQDGMVVYLVDETGNADTDPVDVEDSSGTTLFTIAAANSIVKVVYDGGEWLYRQYIPELTVGKVDTTTPSGVTAVKRVHPGFQVLTSDEFDLADDATQTLLSGIDAGDVLTVWICNTDSGRAAVFQASGANVTLAEEGFNGSWEPSDTDGANCLFNSGGDLVVKNRTGSAAQTYRVVANHLTDGTI